MPRNETAAPGHVCPGIRIHAIDIVQPPGIGISPIADMDAHQAIVTAALAAKSSAETPKTLAEKLARKPSVVRSPVAGCATDNHDFAQRLSYSSWRRIRQSDREILKFEANLAEVLLGFVILEGSDDFLQRKTAVDNGLQTIDRYRPNHVLLICSAANGDPGDTNLVRKQCRDRHFYRKTSQDAD